jgi:hypothetical protein
MTAPYPVFKATSLPDFQSANAIGVTTRNGKYSINGILPDIPSLGAEVALCLDPLECWSGPRNIKAIVEIYGLVTTHLGDLLPAL